MTLQPNQRVRLSWTGLDHFRRTKQPFIDYRHNKRTLGRVVKVLEGALLVRRDGSIYNDYYYDAFWEGV